MYIKELLYFTSTFSLTLDHPGTSSASINIFQGVIRLLPHLTPKQFIRLLDSTHALVHLDISGGDNTKTYSLVIRQAVHSRQTNIESTRGHVNSKNIDSLVNVAGLKVQLVASTAGGAVPAINGERTTDQRECRQRAKCGVFVYEAVDSI